ncbi:MAG TPA: M13 family metallopeptidase [Gemmatimonadales bacterium]|nr:M13 family metallopeptidase [Gemmatimonadales bacterium]
MGNTPRIVALWLALALVLPLPARAQEALPPLRAVDRANMDTTCAPCTDFFRYVNGAWLDRTTIPPQYTVTGVDRDIEDRTEALLERILNAAARDARTTDDPDTRRVGLFYGSCMDSARVEREAARPLAAELGRIAAIRSRSELVGEMGQLEREGISSAIPFFVLPDPRNSRMMMLHFYQGGLGLPDRDFYLRADTAFTAVRTAYLAHIGRMLALLGQPAPAARHDAARVLALETAIARTSIPAEEAQQFSKLYHPTAPAQLHTLAPAIDWPRFYSAAGAPAAGPPSGVVNVSIPVFLKGVDSLVAAVPLADWRAYLRWHLARAAAPALSTPFQRESLVLRRLIRGETELKPRWQRCLQATDGNIGEALGQAYVKVAFTPEAKARAHDMIANLRAAMRDRIAALTWMSDSTRTQALAKLDAVVAKIGYPDKWRDYSRLRLVRGPYVANVLLARRFENDREMRQVGGPVDRTEWGMTPPTYNAYYNPQFNEVVFPAGILQPPLFDPNADDAVNYGATGATIGHELTHGFDDEGRKFDAQGNLRNWWTAADSAGFEARSQVVVEQYNGYVAVDTFHVNGRLTLGENIADIGGLMIAYDAWRKSLAGKPEPPRIDGFTPAQRFFLAYAASWREKVRPEAERTWVVSDPHTSIRWRVNGVVGHLPAFAEAFGCRAADAMVRPPDGRMRIW